MSSPKRKITFIEFHPFYQCCTEAVQKLLEVEDEYSRLSKEIDEDRISEDDEEYLILLQHQMDMHEITACIFAVTTAESFINWYSSSFIEGDQFYTVENLESLSLLSKWVVIPFIACGKEINKDSNTVNEFKELIRARNSLIHAKPAHAYNVPDDKFEAIGMKFDNRIKDRRRIAKRAGVIIVNLLSELKKVDERQELVDFIEDIGISP